MTNHDIAEALRKSGFEVQKSQVRMPSGPLKSVGEHSASVVTHSDVVVSVTVVVVAETD